MAAPFTVGDVGTTLSAIAKDGDAAANLTGATGEAHIAKPDGTVITAAATITDPATGVWSYTWQAGDLSVAGNHRAELQVRYSSGSEQTYGPISFYVQPQIA